MAWITNREKWAPVLGNFMLHFGTIEACVNDLLKQRSAPPDLISLLVMSRGVV